jgi:hypothetical protein
MKRGLFRVVAAPINDEFRAPTHLQKPKAADLKLPEVARLVLGPPQNQGESHKRDGDSGDYENALEWHDCSPCGKNLWPSPNRIP